MKKTYVLLLSFLLLLLVDDVKAQLKLGDQPTSVQKSVILDLQGSNGRQGVWLPRISDTSNATGIDGLNPPDGVLIFHTPSSQLMIRVNGYWQSLVPTTGVYTITHGSQSVDGPNVDLRIGTAAGGSKDFNIDIVPGQDRITLNLPDASIDTRGVVTISSQTFNGLKTFDDGLTSQSTTTINGSSSNASNLYLGITSATSPGATTDRFLTVDNSGRVVLSQGIPSTRTMTINGTTYDLSANRTWSVGTVTSLTGGYGLSGGTITSSGTFAVDTFSVATRGWRQKGIDSVAGLLGNYVPSTRTLNGLALSSNHAFAVGTSGNDFNISSSGTTHTFNIPDASATARGAITTGSQTFAGLKTFSTGVTVSGATSNASNLTLGITSATTPGSVTDRYLTVDATGKVMLSSMSVVNSLAAIGNSPNANGATLSGGVLTLQPASLSFGGVVTTGTQTFEGNKTFDNTVSARVDLQAGTATAGTAPLKFNSGTNLTTPENGTVEYNGTNYFVTSGGVRYTLAKTLTATATLDFPNTGGFGTSSTLTITVNGAADGDAVVLGIPSASMAIDGTYTAYVSAANTVTIVFTNNTWGSLNPGSGTFRVSVLKY